MPVLKVIGKNIQNKKKKKKTKQDTSRNEKSFELYSESRKGRTNL